MEDIKNKKEPQLKGIKVNIKTNLDELSKLFDELDRVIKAIKKFELIVETVKNN